MVEAWNGIGNDAAYNHAQTPRGASAHGANTPPPHCLTALGQRASCPLHDISRKDIGLLTSDFANRPLSEVRCLLSHLKPTARKGNNRKESNNMRKHTWKAAISAAAICVAAAASVSYAADLDAYNFRYDFSSGKRVFFGSDVVPVDPLSDTTIGSSSRGDMTELPVDGPDGANSAAHPMSTGWSAGDSSSRPLTLYNFLNGKDWTFVMSVRPGTTNNGVIFSIGRRSIKSRKGISICSSSDPTKLIIDENQANGSNQKSRYAQITLDESIDVSRGFHTVVVVYKKPASGNAGTYYFYVDGVYQKNHKSVNYAFGGGFQFCTTVSGNTSGEVGTVNDLNVAFRDMRFYQTAFTAEDAQAYAALYPADTFRPSASIRAYGVNCIDTGYLVKPTTRIAADFQYTEIAEQARIFGEQGALGCHLYINGTYKEFASLINDSATYTGSAFGSGGSGSANTSRAFVWINRQTGKANLWQRNPNRNIGETLSGTCAADAETSITLPLFAEYTATVTQRWSKALIYSIDIQESGTPVHFFAPATNETGAAGFRDVITGEFKGESMSSPSTALTYTDGFGSADDYKYESGTLYVKVYAAPDSTAKGGIAVRDSEDAVTAPESDGCCWIPYGTNVTLTATPAAGYMFTGWSGDTQAIVSGSTSDAIVTVSFDRVAQLRANFVRSEKPLSAYAQSGSADFLAHYDGIENAGAGMHLSMAATWTDLTGNNLTLTKTGSAGFISDAWKSDGSSYFSATSQAVKDALTAKTFTLEMVISHPSSQNDYEYWAYFGAASATRHLVVDLRKKDSSNKLVQGLQYRAAKWNNAAKVPVNSGMDWNKRQYIAVVCNGDNVATAYYDGTNEFHSVSGTTNPSSTQIGIGANGADGGCKVYDGSQICAVRMTSRALSADELMRNWYVDTQRFNMTTVPDGYRFTDGAIEVRVTRGVPGFEFSTDGGTTWTTEEVWTPINAELTLTARYVADPTVAVPLAGLPDGATVSGNSATFTPSRPCDVSTGVPTLDLSGSAVWGEGTWRIGETTVAAPTGGSATVNLTDGDATLTLDGDIDLGSLRVVGSGVLTIVRGAHTYRVESIETASGTRHLVSTSNGKITYEYTSTGFLIKELHMTPAQGETLVLSDGVLNFAEGAKIFPGAGGELGGRSVIASAFTTAGALEILGVTNVTPLAAEDMSKLTFAATGTLTLPALSGQGVEVTFDANAFGEPTDGDAAPTATVKANGAITMTDSAFVVRGDATHPIVYDVAVKYALPKVIDFWGNATLTFSGVGAYNDGMTKGTDTITMHPGTTATSAKAYSYHFASGEVVLDGATLTHSDGSTYIYYLTLSNAASASVTGGYFQFGYTAANPVLKVSGTGASTFNGYFSVLGTNKSTGVNNVTIDVEDTVAGEGVDFVMAGNISSDGSYKSSSFIKTGAGTMRLDGVATLNQPIQVREGTLLLNRAEGSMAAANQISLQGGTLALAAGTSNEVASVTLTASSAMMFGEGASFTCESLTIPEGSTLNLTGDLKNPGLRVSNALDRETRRRIRFNGARASQDADGYIRRARGFTIIVK